MTPDQIEAERVMFESDGRFAIPEDCDEMDLYVREQQWHGWLARAEIAMRESGQ